MTRKAKRRGRRPLEDRIDRGAKIASRAEPKWGACESCGNRLPLVKKTGMCGPCTFGEADTLLTAGR